MAAVRRQGNPIGGTLPTTRIRMGLEVGQELTPVELAREGLREQADAQQERGHRRPAPEFLEPDVVPFLHDRALRE